MNKIGFPGLNIDAFSINPIAFSIGSIDIHWYGIIIAFGFLLAIFTCVYLAKESEITSDNLYDIVIFATPVAVICARAYYVIFNFSEYKNNLSDIFKIWEGGIAIYGAIIGAVITAYIYCRVKKISVKKTFDIACIGLAIGQCIGRWGNFINAEAYGRETDILWRMTVLSESMTKAIEVHPTFLYESLWNLCLIFVLILILKHKKFDGQVFATYIFGYGIGRAMIEGLRTDSLYIASFRVSQLVAVISALTALIYIIYKLLNSRRSKINLL